jgi:hypothetical protein
LISNNNLWWQGILYRITKSNCSGKIFNIVKNYFIDRESMVKSSDETIKRKISKGSPQSSILGPAIFFPISGHLVVVGGLPALVAGGTCVALSYITY